MFYSISEKRELRARAQIELGLKEIFIDRNLPFRPNFRYYIYLEPTFDHCVYSYFRKHLAEINSKDEYRQILYFPLFIDQELVSIVKYNRPGIEESILSRICSTVDNINEIYNSILSHVKGPLNVEELSTPCLITSEDSKDIEDYRFSLYPLVYKSDNQFGQLIKSIFDVPGYDSGIRYSTIEEHLGVLESSISEKIDPNEKYNWADKHSITELASEIQERIEKLQLMGVSDFAIRSLIKLPEAKLSPLLITPDYRIILPAYDNMEIEMPTLSKVVFFFFLRHPAGLRFKELIDYKAELLQIYCTVSNRENMEKMEQSISELVDSTRNSINEKCSRIRAAFISKFADDIAHNYYITGSSSTPKRITLDRNMLIDKTGIIKI
ncbi:MAG: hypothetical protein J6V75_04500 [Bacteroidaceae bacterium]|nr:hypothetical protein [Bacteroidaceae bacterium]